MSHTSIRSRVESALNDKNTTNEQIKFLEDALRENASKCGSQFLISWLGFLGAILAWILMRNATITKVSVLSFEISDIEIASQILLPVAAFFFYQGQSFFMMEQLIQTSLNEIYEVYAPTFSKHGVTNLLHYPSFLHIDNALDNLLDKKSILHTSSELWVVLLLFIMSIVPAILLCGMAVLMVISSSNSLISIASAALVFLFSARSILVFVIGWNVNG